ncbi:MAG: hypothetical protein AAB861_03680 [Patescibacteria group bacterium]|mgnify:CR=1 FL=1
MNYEYRIKNNKKGFVALITAIILSLILIVITVTLNQSGFFTRSIILDSEYKERSVGLAEACVDVALLRLANDPTYAGGPPAVNIGAEQCNIATIAPPGTEYRIKTWAVVNSATTNLCVVANTSDLSIKSWNELPNFTSFTCP